MKPSAPDKKQEKISFRLRKRAWQLLGIDAVWILLVGIFMFLIYPSGVTRLSTAQALIQIGIMLVCIISVRS